GGPPVSSDKALEFTLCAPPPCRHGDRMTLPEEDSRAVARDAWARAASGDPELVLARASADAGFRSYWRATGRGGATLVVMDSPPALEDVRPWLRMHAVLESGGVRVPRVLARDVEHGFLLLEDL